MDEDFLRGVPFPARRPRRPPDPLRVDVCGRHVGFVCARGQPRDVRLPGARIREGDTPGERGEETGREALVRVAGGARPHEHRR